MIYAGNVFVKKMIKNKQLRIFAKKLLRKRRYTLQELLWMTYPTKLIRSVFQEIGMFEKIFPHTPDKVWQGACLPLPNLGD